MKHPIRTASATLRELFDIVESQGLNSAQYSELSGIHSNQISEYRVGKREPRIMTVEEMAGALGYRLALVPLDDPDKPR